MKPGKTALRGLLPFIWVATVLLSGCAGVREVRVDYGPPAPSSGLEGKSVFVTFRDLREDPGLLGPGARGAYRYYSGNVALYLVEGGGAPEPAGMKDVASLFRDVFARRVRLLGGEVAKERAAAHAEISIGLKVFSLDLRGRTWAARMAYDLELIVDQRAAVRREVSGEAERAKIAGFKQAEQVMGDLFTDVVNRPHLPALFREAGL
jgi:hypothetical protein